MAEKDAECAKSVLKALKRGHISNGLVARLKWGPSANLREPTSPQPVKPCSPYFGFFYLGSQTDSRTSFRSMCELPNAGQVVIVVFGDEV
jgi:hypothetical protein